MIKQILGGNGSLAIKKSKSLFTNEWESSATRRSIVSVATTARKTALNTHVHVGTTFYLRPNIRHNNTNKIITSKR